MIWLNNLYVSQLYSLLNFILQTILVWLNERNILVLINIGVPFRIIVILNIYIYIHIYIYIYMYVYRV